MAKKERKKVDGKAWMDTYSDMVTLLLCFFVLLFSMSTLDAQKWQIMVSGFNPDAESSSQVVLNQDTEPTESTTAIDDGGDTLLDDSDEIKTGASAGSSDSSSTSESEAMENIESMDDLYEALTEYIENNGLGDQITLFEGDDYVYVMFSNNIFFDGDSSVLKSEGKAILDTFAKAIEQVSSLVSKIQVLGHTNQADPNKPNNVETDRYLSSNRAVEVLVYLQEKNIVEPKVLESIGYGQHYPIGSFSDPEGRAKNRRVELIIGQDPTGSINIDQIYSDIKNAQASGELTTTIIDADAG
jgi:chemotaxis protein MotB